MRFAKLQALGNDFLVIEAADVRDGVAYDGLARGLCDRHFGAGADGLILVSPGGPGDEAQWTSRIFNADGSEAEVSGNGTRCLAAYIDLRIGATDLVTVRTVAGVKRLQIMERSGTTRLIRMEMGVPCFASARIPFACEPPLDRVIDHPLEAAGRPLRATILSVGNPHCSLFADVNGDLDPGSIGPAVERHSLFPNRVNVEFVDVIDRNHIGVRFWERGVGHTLSSGTGSSAAAVAAAASGRTDRDVTVTTASGDLHVQWRDKDDVVLLTGPAELLYTAHWDRTL